MDAPHRYGNLRRFLGYLKPYRWWLLLSTVVGILKYNLPVVFPWILKDFVEPAQVRRHEEPAPDRYP
jgi:hypothetical protein